MPRKRTRTHHELDDQIVHAFSQVLKCVAHRTGRLVLLDAETYVSAQVRYGPMGGLLASERGLSASGARALSQEHRRCYFAYLADLRREVREARQDHARVMASVEKWNLTGAFAWVLLSESSLLTLWLLGWKSSLGLPVTAEHVIECLDLLLADLTDSQAPEGAT